MLPSTIFFFKKINKDKKKRIHACHAYYTTDHIFMEVLFRLSNDIAKITSSRFVRVMAGYWMEEVNGGEINQEYSH